MAWDFEADSEQQNTLGSNLISSSETFLNNCKEIVETQVGTNLSAHWVGDDYTAFNNGVQGYYPAIKDLGHTFELFGKHFQKMSGGTEELSTNVQAVAIALLHGGAAGSSVGGAGEGMTTEGALANSNPNPNAYGGRTIVDSNGKVIETDANGNYIYTKETLSDGTIVETRYGDDGTRSVVRTALDGSQGIQFLDEQGNDIGGTYSHGIFNDDGTFNADYLSEKAAETGTGLNEYGGVTAYDVNNPGTIVKTDGNDNLVETITVNPDGTFTKVIEGTGLLVTTNSAGVIIAASLNGADLNVDQTTGTIVDPNLPDNIDPNTGSYKEGAYTSPKSTVDPRKAMAEDVYGEPTVEREIAVDPDKVKAHGEVVSDEKIENDDGTVTIKRTYDDGTVEEMDENGEIKDTYNENDGLEHLQDNGEGEDEEPENPEGDAGEDEETEEPEGDAGEDEETEEPEGDAGEDEETEEPEGDAGEDEETEEPEGKDDEDSEDDGEVLGAQQQNGKPEESEHPEEPEKPEEPEHPEEPEEPEAPLGPNGEKPGEPGPNGEQPPEKPEDGGDRRSP